MEDWVDFPVVWEGQFERAPFANDLGDAEWACITVIQFSRGSLGLQIPVGEVDSVANVVVGTN